MQPQEKHISTHKVGKIACQCGLLGDQTAVTDKRIVLTTTGSRDDAHQIAHALVERQLAACVNVVERIESVYRWEGRVASAREWLLIIKTTESAFDHVRQAIKELHPYELPEILSIAVQDGGAEYLNWIEENSKAG